MIVLKEDKEKKKQVKQYLWSKASPGQKVARTIGIILMASGVFFLLFFIPAMASGDSILWVLAICGVFIVPVIGMVTYGWAEHFAMPLTGGMGAPMAQAPYNFDLVLSWPWFVYSFETHDPGMESGSNFFIAIISLLIYQNQEQVCNMMIR